MTFDDIDNVSAMAIAGGQSGAAAVFPDQLV